MKTTLILTATLLTALGALGQGLINFNTKVIGSSSTEAPGQVWAPVYLPDPSDPILVKRGNTSTGIPPGTTTYGGGYVIGTGFTAQLWGGPAGITEDRLVLVATTTFRTQTATTVAGTVVPPLAAPSVPGVPAGALATFQLRVWDNCNSTVTSWAQVQDPASPIVWRGESALFTPPFPLGNGSTIPVPNLQGLESFNIGNLSGYSCIPEPSVLALGLLGAGAFWFVRRWKQSLRQRFGQRR